MGLRETVQVSHHYQLRGRLGKGNWRKTLFLTGIGGRHKEKPGAVRLKRLGAQIPGVRITDFHDVSIGPEQSASPMIHKSPKGRMD